MFLRTKLLTAAALAVLSITATDVAFARRGADDAPGDVRQEDRQADRQQDRQADRQQDRQADRQQDRQADRRADRRAN